MIIRHKDINIYFEDHGKGEVLVLLHGFLETSAMWRSLITELSTTHRIITVDLLGHGKTGCFGNVHTMEAMADTVNIVLQHLELQNYALIGHSMGGYVALAMAEQYPERLTGLCLMNSTYEADNPERKAIRQRAVEMATTNYDNLVRMSFANLFAPESKITYKADFEAALSIALQTPVQGYIAAQNGMTLRPNRWKVLKDLNVPRAIITGKKDGLVDSDTLRQQLQNTGIRYEEFSGGHMSHIENYMNLLTFLLHFIEKL